MKKIFLLVILMAAIKESPAQEKNIKEIISSYDTTQQYSLYLPQNYDSSKKYPLIIFFDPIARGKMPVSLYSNIADNYGIILAGSMNSKNFSASSSNQAVQAIYDDMMHFYAVDPANIYLAGFSGGSRVASEITIENKNIFHGIIACGAGFSTKAIIKDDHIPYAALVGTKDMNYSELWEVHNNLDAIDNENIMVVFDGPHEWPPADYMELAIVWLLQKNINEDLLTPLKTKWQQKLRERVTTEPGYAAFFDLLQLDKIAVLHSLSDSLQKIIAADKDFSKDKKKYEQSLDQEKEYSVGFAIAFTNATSFESIDSVKEDDWNSKIYQIEGMRKSKNKYMQLAGERCLDKSFRSCAEYTIQLVGIGQYVEAYNLSHIWSFFTPTNPNSYYFMAESAAGLNEKKLASVNLKKAIQNGVTSPRVMADTLFQKVFSKEELEGFFKK